MIINFSIDKSDNLVLNQLSQVVRMKFDMLHFVVCNEIMSKLNCTMIVAVKKIRGLDRKPMFTRDMVNQNILCTYINDAMILSFHSRKRDYLFFSYTTKP
jgi:hypothetical protein